MFPPTCTNNFPTVTRISPSPRQAWWAHPSTSTTYLMTRKYLASHLSSVSLELRESTVDSSIFPIKLNWNCLSVVCYNNCHIMFRSFEYFMWGVGATKQFLFSLGFGYISFRRCQNLLWEHWLIHILTGLGDFFSDKSFVPNNFHVFVITLIYRIKTEIKYENIWYALSPISAKNIAFVYLTSVGVWLSWVSNKISDCSEFHNRITVDVDYKALESSW